MKTSAWAAVSLFAAAALAAVSCSSRSEREEASAVADPLENAWRFACAITNDANDRALCQERVALAHAFLNP